MRLICPNCGAQYDVPANAIPEAGRDVQCSGCGHTWFQRHPDTDPELAEELNQPLPDPEWTPEPEPNPDPETHPDPEPAAMAPPGQAQPPKRDLDPEMAELFRQERELAARQRAAEALETQPDLGLALPEEDERARRSRQAQQRIARIKGEETDHTAPATRAPTPEPDPQTRHEAAATAAAGSRRDLLPDVEEINQTLRATSRPRVVDSARDGLGPGTEGTARGGFGRGFLLVVGLVSLAVLLYAFAPRIAETVPSATPALETYVAAVNGLRDGLDAQLTELLEILDGMSSEAPQPDAAADAPAPIGN